MSSDSHSNPELKLQGTDVCRSITHMPFEGYVEVPFIKSTVDKMTFLPSSSALNPKHSTVVSPVPKEPSYLVQLNVVVTKFGAEEFGSLKEEMEHVIGAVDRDSMVSKFNQNKYRWSLKFYPSALETKIAISCFVNKDGKLILEWMRHSGDVIYCNGIFQEMADYFRQTPLVKAISPLQQSLESLSPVEKTTGCLEAFKSLFSMVESVFIDVKREGLTGVRRLLEDPTNVKVLETKNLLDLIRSFKLTDSGTDILMSFLAIISSVASKQEGLHELQKGEFTRDIIDLTSKYEFGHPVHDKACGLLTCIVVPVC